MPYSDYDWVGGGSPERIIQHFLQAMPLYQHTRLCRIGATHVGRFKLCGHSNYMDQNSGCGAGKRDVGNDAAP